MTTSRNLAAFGTVSNQQQSNRNLLYNGAMQVAQRGTSVAGVLSSSYNTADRWLTDVGGGLGVWTQSREADAPSGTGLRNSLKMLCTTNSGSPGASDMLNIAQRIEGQDLQRIAKGTASAQQLTLSFWVKSNVTGTYTVFVYDPTNNRSVGAQYAVSVSATWERKTITIPSDTTGQIVNSNAEGLGLYWCLGAGSSLIGGTVQSAWGTYAAANRAPGQVNLAAATNNYWQVTGVQLETGPAATPFEFKSYGQELRECQRYYWRNSGTAGAGSVDTTSSAYVVMPFPTTMRTDPAPTYGGTAVLANYAGTQYAITGMTTAVPGLNAQNVRVTIGSASLTLGHACVVFSYSGGWIAFSAEL